jgi:hypothetical protein
MMEHLYFAGFVATMAMAGFAKSDKNYGEMRALLVTAVLFLSLWLEKSI